MRRLRAWALIGLVSMAACGTDASAEATPSTAASGGGSSEPTSSLEAGLPAGWVRFTLDEAGFSIALPEEWTTASAEDLGDSGIFERMVEDNPEAAAALEQARLAIESGSIAFFAFDSGERTAQAGFAANINIIDAGGLLGDGTAEEIAAQFEVALPQQIPVDGEVTTDTTTLPAGEAAVVRLDWTLQQGSEGLALSLTTYAILTEGSAYILSMTAPRQFAADFRETWAAMAESFRVE